MPETKAPRMEPAEQLIRQEIARSGPMTFDRFVDIALYHPAYGYYNRGSAQRGRAGDYFTAMQVSGLFPRIFAEVLKGMRETLGAEQFSLVEFGSGGGEFLEGVLKALTPDERKGLRVWAVERSRPAREHLWKRLSRFPKCEVVASFDDIDWMGGLEGCVFSNEFFDALPFQRLRRTDSGWNEISVGLKEGVFIETEAPAQPSPETRGALEGISAVAGSEVEVRTQVPGVYEDIASRLSRGWIVTVDYGHPAAIAGRAPGGTWRCFRGHELKASPYENIGRQDITANVDFSQLARAGSAADFTPQLFASQGIFLAHAGRTVIEDALKQPDPASIQRAVQQLLHPDAMGERFWTLVQGRSVELPEILSGFPNRVARLAVSPDEKMIRG